MSAVIVRGNQAAHLRGGERATRNLRRPLPAEGLGQTQAHSERAGRSGAIFVTGAVACISGEPGSRRNGNHGRLSAIEFMPALKASGSLLPGSARVEFFQKPTRRFADRFQGQFSFPDAPASHGQHAAGDTHEVGAMDQERGNFSQGGTCG